MTLDTAKLRADTLALIRDHGGEIELELSGSSSGSPHTHLKTRGGQTVADLRYSVTRDFGLGELLRMAPTLAADTLRLLDEIERLTAENARLRTERDAAWQAGAEAMRALSISATDGLIEATWADIDLRERREGIRDAADAIRALPLPSQPKETSHAAGAAMGTLLRETVLPILRRSAEDLFRCVSIRNVPDSVSPADWRDIAEDMEAVLAVEAFVGRPDDEYGRTLNPILDARMWEDRR